MQTRSSTKSRLAVTFGVTLAAAAVVVAALLAGAGKTAVTALAAAGMAVVGLCYLWTRNALSELTSLSTQFAEAINQVSSASSQVASASQSLAQGASRQASSIEETSASGHQISATSRQNAQHSQTAATLVQEAEGAVHTAMAKLEQMVSAMVEINASSEKISKIIRVIDEIAFQTNILALNAAVEAARAGEAGMGFAVVAEEVRNLAQRSAQAARDTSSLIEESRNIVTHGTTRLDDVTQSVGVISENSGKVKALVEQVDAGSQEQVRGMEQISKAISLIEQVTQQNAASAQQSAAASQELNAQASAMQDLSRQFQTLLGA